MAGALKTGARIAGGLAKYAVQHPPGFAHFVPIEPLDDESLNGDELRESAAAEDAERLSGAEPETGG